MLAHNANFPHADHDAHDVEEIPASRFRRTALLWASPECFPAGTLVLTAAGLRPIEDLKVGDLVLAHRNRWRRVTATMRSFNETVRVRGHARPTLKTAASLAVRSASQDRETATAGHPPRQRQQAAPSPHRLHTNFIRFPYAWRCNDV